MKFDIITIFPEIFASWSKESLIARAQKKKLVKIKAHDLRKWAKDRHKRVDDRPFGGGLGMVLKVEPIFKAVQKLRGRSLAPSKRKVILFTPRGKKFNQKMAYKFSKLDHLILICGRYEGVDERVAKYITDEKISIGDYDLMGGELAAMVVMETVARLIPGVIGKPKLLKERITKEKGFIEYPQYTRPEVFEVEKYIKKWSACPPKFSAKPKFWRVPKVLLSGHHKKIDARRQKLGKVIE